MITLQTIVQELQQVPPEHLEEVHQLLMRWKKEANGKLLADTMRVLLSETDDLPPEEWEQLNGHMRKLRAEAFTRPTAFQDDEAHAA